MRKLLLAGIFVLAVPAYGAASPCVPDLLSAYIALGSGGCEIGVGGATIADFYSAASLGPGALKVDDDDILVTPASLASGPELVFSFIPPEGTAEPGENEGVQIVYSIAGLSFESASKSMIGSVTDSGAATAVEDLCLGGSFFAPLPGDSVDPTTCSGVSEFLIADPGGGDFKTFPSSFFDIFVSLDMQFDVLFEGSAQVESVTNRFNAVPEPGAFLLFGSGLIGAWFRYRRSLSS